MNPASVIIVSFAVLTPLAAIGLAIWWSWSARKKDGADKAAGHEVQDDSAGR
jgi:hypothetical protein